MPARTPTERAPVRAAGSERPQRAALSLRSVVKRRVRGELGSRSRFCVFFFFYNFPKASFEIVTAAAAGGSASSALCWTQWRPFESAPSRGFGFLLPCGRWKQLGFICHAVCKLGRFR